MEKSESVFGFFGHAITTVTWISFCVVTIFVLVRIASTQEFQSVKGGATRYTWGAVVITGFAAVSSSIFIFFRLLDAARLARDYYMSSQSGFMGWFRKKNAEYMFRGAPYMVLIIAWALSYQALIALGLLPIR